MNSKLTGLCVAAAFGAVATLGAQTTATTSTSQSEHGSMHNGANSEITITGCLQKGADGNYVLTNARMDNSASTSGSTASPTGSATGGTMSGTTGTSGTTSGTTATGTTGSATGATTTAGGATTTAGRGSADMSPASTWQLSGGQDLDKHVGHRIQVTGSAEGLTSSSGSASTGTTGGAVTGSATGSTATGSTAGTTATGTTGSTTGSTAGTTGTTYESMQHGSTSSAATAHRLDVKSVKMVSTSCS